MNRPVSSSGLIGHLAMLTMAFSKYGCSSACSAPVVLRHPISGNSKRVVLPAHSCPPGVEWYIGLIALTIMYNIDESTVLWPIDLSSVLYVLACCGLALAVRQIKFTSKLEALNI